MSEIKGEIIRVGKEYAIKFPSSMITIYGWQAGDTMLVDEEKLAKAIVSLETIDDRIEHVMEKVMEENETVFKKLTEM